VVTPVGPWWRRAPREHRVLTGVAAAVVLVLIGLWSLGQGDGGGDGGSGDGSGDGSADTVSDSWILLTQGTGVNGKVVAYDVGTKEKTELPDERSDIFLPTVSPDRRWIAYLQGKPSEGLVGHVVRADGSEDRVMLGEEDQATCPNTGRAAWNADSTKLAFVCWTGHKKTGLWVVDNSDSARATRLVESGQVSSPTWVGDSVVYSVKGDNDSEPATLWKVSLGGDYKQLTDDAEGWDTSPTAYGNKVLFRRAPGPGDTPGDAWVLDLNGDGNPQQLTTDANVTYPAWSPDGNSIAWITPQGDQGELWTMPLGGTATKESIDGILGAPGWH
jgi:Tol biopolymer transport system component